MLSEGLREMNPVKRNCFAHETACHFECQYSFKFWDFLVTLTTSFCLFCMVIHIPEYMTMYWAKPCKDNDCSAQASFSKSVRMNYAFLFNELCNSKRHQRITQAQQTQTATQWNPTQKIPPRAQHQTLQEATQSGLGTKRWLAWGSVKKISSHLSFRKTVFENENTWICCPVFLVAGGA